MTMLSIFFSISFISGVSLTTRSRMTAEVKCHGKGAALALREVEVDLSVAGEVEAVLEDVRKMHCEIPRVEVTRARVDHMVGGHVRSRRMT